MRYATILGIFLAATWAVAQERSSELDQLQGSWRAVGLEAQGKKLPAEIFEKLDLTITFEGNKYTERQMGKVNEEGTVTVDGTKSPKHIDIHATTGKEKGKSQRAIYKIDGDTMTVALYPPGSEERPTSFTTTAESKFMVQTMRRDKK